VKPEINAPTEGTIAMKKFAFAAVAALAATVSLSSVAQAHRHHDDGDFDFRPHRHNDFDVVVFRRPDCSTTKIIKETDFGTRVVIVKRCD
jgi:hypothetical protein